jgi:hypothetical protein
MYYAREWVEQLDSLPHASSGFVTTYIWLVSWFL